MGAGLIILTANGLDNTYLTGNPQMSYFKYAYKRYTNFAMGTVEHLIPTTVGYGERVSITLPKAGDLVQNSWIKVENVDYSGDTQDQTGGVGMSLIQTVSLVIDGEVIDKQDYRFMHSYCRTFYDQDKNYQINNMGLVSNTQASTIYVPLQFWYCRYGSSSFIPLVSMRNVDVSIEIEFSDGILPFNGESLSPTSTPTATTKKTPTFASVKLCNRYVYLDSEERQKFVSNKLTYLIEQTQEEKISLDPISNLTGGVYTASTDGLLYGFDTDYVNEFKSSGGVITSYLTTNLADYSKNVDLSLTFSHPVKYLLWYIGISDVQYPTEDGPNSCFVKDVTMKVNNDTTVDNQPGKYFYNYQKYNYVPRNLPPGKTIDDYYPASVGRRAQMAESLVNACNPLDNGCRGTLEYLYSFSKYPNSLQPSGSLNFSSVSQFTFNMTYVNYSKTSITPTFYIYAVNYNILQVEKGESKILYSN